MDIEGRSHPSRSFIVGLFRLGVAGGIAVAILVGLSSLVIGCAARHRVLTDPGEVPVIDVAIVPGAFVSSSGELSAALQDRVDTASALYNEGTVSQLLVSGDNSIESYNEPVAMRNRALNQGVPAEDITLDYAGVDTWDTCRRAQEQFGVAAAVLVTQHRYASRAAALCEAAGIDISVLAIDHRPLPGGFSLRNWFGRIREPVAKVKAVGDLIRTPDAQFGGDYIGLVGSVGMPEGGHPPDWDWESNSPG